MCVGGGVVFVLFNLHSTEDGSQGLVHAMQALYD